mgnify:FL=1
MSESPQKVREQVWPISNKSGTVESADREVNNTR